MSVYEYRVNKINGEEISIREFKDKVLLIVNTASKCGFTPQYKQLQELYETFKDQGFEILGFPCNQFMNQEPGTDEEIESFCSVNYGVSFPMFAKVDVNGENAHPLFKYLTNEASGVLGTKAVKWNFTKFLIDKNGLVKERFSPNTNPLELEADIENLLNEA
ncbi:glutathione peroxidase [Metabacillus arenae]|uniref:Glutathione peroxidase n=1 Tax=Metabacillus arenae TaxID=2771434 RepID=A0A926NDR8_9BACI|nr:glutathione peroxidase [Metabacillus arenae]MBD1381614.1 glutathione peroxidase [Metabacillus arenae]